MVKYKNISHVGLVTAKMDETIRFWRDLLGMKLVIGSGKKGYKQYFFQVSDTSLISFFEWTGAEPIEEKDAGRPVEGQIAYDHVCFEMDSRDALWELQDKLEAADVWVTVVLDSGIVHSFFTFDPNGIAIEFCYRTQAFDLVNQPVMVDTDPPEAAKEGPEPQPGKWPEVAEWTTGEDRKVYEGDVGITLKGKNIWVKE